MKIRDKDAVDTAMDGVKLPSAVGDDALREVPWPEDGEALSSTSYNATAVFLDPLWDNCSGGYGLLSALACDPRLLANFSANGSASPPPHLGPLADVIVMGVTSIVLGLLILATVIGNVFVIAAILLERNLQNVANYLIVSLAVADLMVACLVMPLGAVYEISKGWILGPELCDMWTSSDVLCCTASILHLVAIAVDRYWAVTNVDYIHNRNSSRIGGMIVVVWTVALVVSLAPQFGWKDPDYLDRINLQQRCLVSQDVAYQIFATCSTFYVPLLVILVLYWKIFQTARKRIHRRRQPSTIASGPGSLRASKTSGRFGRLRGSRPGKKSSAAEVLVSSVMLVEGHSTASVADEDPDTRNSSGASEDKEDPKQATTAFTISQGLDEAARSVATANNVSPEKTSSSTAPATANNGSAPLQRAATESKDKLLANHARRDKKESLEAKRERKAAKTLAIITGAFVVCWLPFFIMALLMPLCESCQINDYVASVFLWLGYFNSTLNPVIYTIFSPEFRQAFKRILCGSGRRTRSKNFRPSKVK
uniref:5-hydroxytryptamine receptor n=1 Tax=Carausius morosus TaxID=7022 RepID=A0A891XHZ5_CARMO|nr:5-hydroxytryptamine receptor [Carausius morosus]